MPRRTRSASKAKSVEFELLRETLNNLDMYEHGMSLEEMSNIVAAIEESTKNVPSKPSGGSTPPSLANTPETSTQPTDISNDIEEMGDILASVSVSDENIIDFGYPYHDLPVDPNVSPARAELSTPQKRGISEEAAAQKEDEPSPKKAKMDKETEKEDSDASSIDSPIQPPQIFQVEALVHHEMDWSPPKSPKASDEAEEAGGSDSKIPMSEQQAKVLRVKENLIEKFK